LDNSIKKDRRITVLAFAHVIDDSENPRFLYVLSAQSGSFDGETLTLTGVPSVIYFSDRPYRIARIMCLEKFVEMWGEGSDSYEVDPPNATLSIFDDEGNENTVIELTDPQIEGDVLTYKTRLLEGIAPKSFGGSSLFIDSGPWRWAGL
jgi:hypothetical protein